MLIPCSQHPENQQDLFALDSQLRSREDLIHLPAVQRLLKAAHSTFDSDAYTFAIGRLHLILRSEITQELRTPDEFRPHCPRSLSRTGRLHLMDQVNGLPIFINHHKFVTGLGIFGPPGAGKSYVVVDLCGKIRQIAPDTRIVIIDPKGAFSNLASFRHIDMDEASFDLMPPSNTNVENFVYELMPILAQTGGLIYGLNLLNEAADIALHQRRQYIQQTNIDPNICLKDIHEALSLIKVASFRKTGYHDAAMTCLQLIIGRGNLFSCRKGISLDWLFNNNVVLNARCLTGEMECRYFITYLLYWLYQQARFSPETNQIRRILIVDDASRFVGTIGSQFEGGSKTSPLGHILAVLRSAGICFVYATQLPSQLDPAIRLLTRGIVVIGNLNGNENLEVIASMMSLTDRQKAAIARFKPRENLAFISGLDWPHPLHGWTCAVNMSNYTTNNPLRSALDITPWHSLADVPRQTIVETEKPLENSTPRDTRQTSAEVLIPKNSSKVNTSVDRLVLDCIHNWYAKAKDHAEKMDSFREYDAAKMEAVQGGLLITSQCGKSLYLIPTQNAYDKFGVINPYRRAASVEHAFYVRLAAHILKQHAKLSVQIETPIGTKGATIDVTAADKSGNITAYEVTISLSNLASNASKLQDTAYQKIVWLCRDADTVKAVKAYFNKSSSLPSELTAKFEYVHFGKWSSQIQKGKE